MKTNLKYVVLMGALLFGFFAVVPPQAFAGAKEDAASTADGVVNLNTATEDELSSLPGVGPSKASAVVSWRKKHGAFKEVAELTKVKGFGHKTLGRLKPNLTVSGPTTFHGKVTQARTAKE